MAKTPINAVLAANLQRLMQDSSLYKTQLALAAKSGVAQTTISLYLHPDKREPGNKGKRPSARLHEVERLAEALGVEVWQLLRPTTADDAEGVLKRFEEAYEDLKAITRVRPSPEAPATVKESRKRRRS